MKNSKKNKFLEWLIKINYSFGFREIIDFDTKIDGRSVEYTKSLLMK